MGTIINDDRRATLSLLSAPIALALLGVMILLNPEGRDIIWPTIFAPISLGIAIAGVVFGSQTNNTKRGKVGYILSALALLPCLWGLIAAMMLFFWWIAMG